MARYEANNFGVNPTTDHANAPFFHLLTTTTSSVTTAYKMRAPIVFDSSPFFSFTVNTPFGSGISSKNSMLTSLPMLA